MDNPLLALAVAIGQGSSDTATAIKQAKTNEQILQLQREARATASAHSRRFTRISISPKGARKIRRRVNVGKPLNRGLDVL
jgi:hypothetical protein